MAVTTANAASVAAAANAQVTASRGKMAANSQTFLTLLTTQLKNQDPTAPTDMNSMTQQLTQMTGVEQQLLSNELLTKLVSQSANAMGTAVGLIGKTVTAASNVNNIATAFCSNHESTIVSGNSLTEHPKAFDSATAT